VAEEKPTPEQEVRRLYEDAETRVAKAAERMVSRDSFGELLAMATENVVAITRIGFDTLDLLWSNLRLAGRRDVTRLSQRIARSEDKLELVLQEVEHLRADLDGKPAARDGNAARSRSRRSQSSRRDQKSGST
jgi:hypothetical protein